MSGLEIRLVSQVPENSRVILRLDTDLPAKDNQNFDNRRLLKSLDTISVLLQKKCRILILGHRGRPSGSDSQLSLKPIYLELMALLEADRNDIASVFWSALDQGQQLEQLWLNSQIIFAENVRFWPGEEDPKLGYLKPIVDQSQVFVNDAISVAHRSQASTLLHHFLPSYYGFNFGKEIKNLQSLVDLLPQAPTVILGGAKIDKLGYLQDLCRFAGHILVGGKLPLLVSQFGPNSFSQNPKIVFAKLRPDQLDLSDQDIAEFKNIISLSSVIIWAGAMGYFEKPDSRRGTQEIAQAVSGSKAYKAIAGGDTVVSVESLGLIETIDFVCSGGGVLLEYLTKETLPTIS